MPKFNIENGTFILPEAYLSHCTRDELVEIFILLKTKRYQKILTGTYTADADKSISENPKFPQNNV